MLIEASPILSSGELSSLLHRLTFVQLYDKRERDDDATLSTHVSDTISYADLCESSTCERQTPMYDKLQLHQGSTSQASRENTVALKVRVTFALKIFCVGVVTVFGSLHRYL